MDSPALRYRLFGYDINPPSTGKHEQSNSYNSSAHPSQRPAVLSRHRYLDVRAVRACDTLSFPADGARVGDQRREVAEAAADSKGTLYAHRSSRLGNWRRDCARRQFKPCISGTGYQILCIISRHFFESEELVIHLNNSVRPPEHNMYRHHNSRCRYRNRTRLY